MPPEPASGQVQNGLRRFHLCQQPQRRQGCSQKRHKHVVQPGFATYLQLRTNSIKVLAAIPEGPLGIYDFSV